MTLPPDQSLRKYRTNQQLIVLSVAEGGVQIGEDTEYSTFDHEDYTNGVYIYAEKVSATHVSAPRPYGLIVSTWHLSGLDGDQKERLTLDVSGRRGATGTPGNPDGRPGNDGSTVGLYVQDLDDKTASTLVLLARGGAGGDSFSSEANAGAGGNGGRIVSVLQPTYLRVLQSVQRYLKYEEFDPAHKSQWDQMSVVKQDPIFVSASTLVAAGEDLSASADTITKIFGTLRDEVNKESTTVAALRRGAHAANHALSNLIQEQRGLVALDPDYFRGGYRGMGGKSEAKTGDDGMVFNLYASTMAKIVTAPLPFAHPLQCAMLLERADIYFCVNSPATRSRAEKLYQRLVERLDFLQFVHSPESRLKSFYESYEQSGVMPRNSLKRLADILQSATARLRSLKSGITDFYGHAERWVPRASYTEYKDALDKALADFKVFEDAYILYNSALNKQHELKDQVELATKQTSGIVARLEDDKSRHVDELQDLARKIDEKKDVVMKAQNELMKAYNAQKSKIRKAFTLSIPQIIEALRSIAMFPEKGVTTVEAGDLIFQGHTSIPLKSGGTVKKEYLISEFKKSEASITSISLELKHKLDGTYPLDEAFAKRLVVEKERMMAELDKFSEEAFGNVDDATTRKELEDCFDTYIREVTERNNLIYDYNIRVKRIEDTYEEIAKYEGEDRDFKNTLAKQNNPNLPTITAHVDAIYQSSRSRVMRLLDVLLRALRFRTLGQHYVLDFAFKSGTYDLDKVPLSLTFTELTNARSNIEDVFREQVAAWRSEPALFPPDFSWDRGKRHHLKDDERKRLITKHPVTLTIPPDLEDSDFKGYCNVRIYMIRFGLTGLKTADGVKDTEDAKVQVALTHHGKEIILSRDKAIDFEHDPVSVKYLFTVKTDRSVSALSDGNIGLADINKTATSYAAPGPFAEWTVSLDEGTEFDKLNFDDVTDAYFDFCGTEYALD